MRTFKTVSSLQRHLKKSILSSIENRLTDICIEVVKKYIQKNVYDVYVPQGDNAYDRTFDLLNSVTVGNLKIGTKYATFEIFIDTEKISPHLRRGLFGNGGWNAHADMYNSDVSDYIPLWIEEGTSGSLWDRDGAYYMHDSWFELSGGKLTRELADALRKEGWGVVEIS